MSNFLALAVVTSCKISDKSNDRLLRIMGTDGKETHFLPLPPPPRGRHDNFPVKSENVTFPRLGSCNLMQHFKQT